MLHVQGALHHAPPFYAQLCPGCAALNYRMRHATADLSGRVALLTGARVKIGLQIGLKLLRAGATLVATSRFPADMARRYAEEPDFPEWRHRLQLHAADLRDVHALERFCDFLLATLPRLDIIINNACQTVRRPASYYAHLLPGEAEMEDGARAAGGARAGRGRRAGAAVCGSARRGARPGGRRSSPLRRGRQSRSPRRAALPPSPAALGAAATSTAEDATPLTALPDGATDAATALATAARRAARGAPRRQRPADRPADDQLVAAETGRRLDARARRGVCDQHARPVSDQRAAAAAARRHRAALRRGGGRGVRRQRLGDGGQVLPAQDGEPPAHEHGEGGAQHDDAHVGARARVEAADLHDRRRHRLDQRREPARAAARNAEENGFQTPIDEVDAAARVLHPVFDGLATGAPLFGGS